jgi:hypothetical protein
MSDIFADSMTWFNAAFAGEAARLVTYVRGLYSCSWNATPGRQDYPLDGVETIKVSWAARDYTGAISELVLNGTQITPENGDQIIDVINRFTVTLELRDEEGAKPYVYADSAQTRIRVHAFEINRA